MPNNVCFRQMFNDEIIAGFLVKLAISEILNKSCLLISSEERQVPKENYNASTSMT